MNIYKQAASLESLSRTVKALESNGFRVYVANNKAQAKKFILDIIPESSEVMSNTSATLDAIGVKDIIDNDSKYYSIHKKVLKMDRSREWKRIKEMRSVPDWAIGSFHAVTEEGNILMASGSGSQIPGYAYGASKVVLVAGTNKIVKTIDDGIKRIYNHSLPLESKRLKTVYNDNGGSNVRRILIMNSERDRERTTIVLVKEVLGF